MIPNVVVDVGNTRIKWGAVAPSGGAIGRAASLPEDEAEWHAELDAWQKAGVVPAGPLTWLLTSVRPVRAERLRAWLLARGDRVEQLSRAAQLPLTIGLPEPDKAGIDRLLNAVAAKRMLSPGNPAVLIDAGSAVTIDWLDEDHVFRGGLIAPGLDLMARALNSYTALLPVVEVTLPIPSLPADRTTTAMQAGIYLSVSGCIRESVRLYASQSKTPPRVYLTGGQAVLLSAAMKPEAERQPPWHTWTLWPNQTLMGILYAAEGLP
jgi:type III pantothenate kinase